MNEQDFYPLVSVIVPVYNVDGYLERCVNSILSQTYTNLEIILVDDGSTDRCAMLCDYFGKADERIKVVHKKNGGLSSARNAGLKVACGDYLVYVDSDDFIGDNHVLNLLSTALGADAKVAVTGATSFPDGSSFIPPSKKPQSYLCFGAIEAICVAISAKKTPFAEHAWGKIFHSSLAPLLVFPEGKHFEDQFVMYQVFYAAQKVAYENSNDYYYVVERSTSISNQYNEKHLDTLEARKEIIEFAKKMDSFDLEAAATQRYYGAIIGEFATFCLSGQSVLEAKMYDRIKQERRDAIKSPFTAFTTRIAFVLSYVPEWLFHRIVCCSEKNLKKAAQRARNQALEEFLCSE